MSETKKRKFHTPEYKAKVALEALRSGKTINQIGQEFDVHPVQVGLWKKAVQEQAKTLFEGILDGAEAIRELWTVLHGFEMGLGIRVVIGGVGSAVALADIEIDQQRCHRFASHARTSIGMQRQRARGEAVHATLPKPGRPRPDPAPV